MDSYLTSNFLLEIEGAAMECSFLIIIIISRMTVDGKNCDGINVVLNVVEEFLYWFNFE